VRSSATVTRLFRLDTGVARVTTISLDDLPNLPPSERAELALALWESLGDSDREAEFTLSAEQLAELERELAVHLADPTASVPWEQVRRKLR
jgi:putative addiction module component (TIGR02574 family)